MLHYKAYILFFFVTVQNLISAFFIMYQNQQTSAGPQIASETLFKKKKK